MLAVIEKFHFCNVFQWERNGLRSVNFSERSFIFAKAAWEISYRRLWMITYFMVIFSETFILDYVRRRLSVETNKNHINQEVCWASLCIPISLYIAFPMKIKQRTGEWFAREHIDVNHRITPKQTNARRIHEEIDEHEAIVTPTRIHRHTITNSLYSRNVCD